MRNNLQKFPNRTIQLENSPCFGKEGKTYIRLVYKITSKEDLNIITLDRQLNPITVIINTESEDIVNEIYSLLI